MKKIFALLLALVMVIPLLAGCKEEPQSQPAAQTDDAVKLWYSYNTENLMQDLEYPELMAERDSTLRLHAVRNDAETMQLMITPGVNIVSYDLTMAELKTEDGQVFAKENFELFAVYYAEVTESYNMDAYYGFYPDALVPLENYKTSHYNFINAGKNQAIMVQANVPADQAPGFYTGTAVLTLDSATYNIPIELTVYDAEIPVENHMQSAYGIWFQQLAYGEGYYSEELAQAYWDFLVERRTMPMYYRNGVTTGVEVFADYIAEELAENPAISCYRLMHTYTNYDLGRIVERESVLSMLTALAKKNVELRQAGNETVDLFKKAYFYLGDVVDEPAGTSIQRVRDCDLIITECKYAVAEEYFKDQYPDLYQSCLEVGHLVTTGYNPDLVGSDTVGGVQTWCPQYQHWQTEAQREEYYARMETPDRQGGEEAWWYGCNNPKVPYPTYHLDDDLIGTRVLFWMQHEYGVQGDLYYCVNIVNHSDNAAPWTEVYYDDAANDGRLLYPGSEFGIFGPISTLRMESIFQGREDYECLWTIEQAIIAYNEANGTDYDPDELMSWLYEDLYEGVIPERDNAEVFAECRVEMLKIMELIVADPAAGIAALES